MSKSAEIWLGDVARAFAALRPADDATRVAIAQLLGLGVPAPVLASIGGGETEDEDGAPTGEPTEVRPDPIADEDAESSYTSDALDGLPLLTPIRSEGAGATGWDAGETLPRVTADHLAGVSHLEPLLAPRSASSVIRKLLAQVTRDGPIDIDAVVDAVARRQPLAEIPQELRGTLRFGAQVLLDVGEGMQPFFRDEQWLAEQVRRVVGPATKVDYFADCPLRGAGPDSPWSWGRYRPPHPATPVLVVSNFGIGGPVVYAGRSRLEEWTNFAQLLADVGCPVMGLVPYPPTRWPADLASRIPLLTMDRGMTVGSVMARVRR